MSKAPWENDPLVTPKTDQPPQQAMGTGAPGTAAAPADAPWQADPTAPTDADPAAPPTTAVPAPEATPPVDYPEGERGPTYDLSQLPKPPGPLVAGADLTAPPGEVFKGWGLNKDGHAHPIFGPPAALKDEGGAADSFGRGAGSAIPFFKDIAAGAQTIGDYALGNQDQDLSSTFKNNRNEQQAIEQYDDANHPTARILGELTAGLAIPVGMEGVAYKAGADALRAGSTMGEARAIASAAARNHMARTALLYGGAHGAGEGDDWESRITNAATEGVLGFGGGQVTGKLGEIVAPRLAARAAASRALPAAEPSYAQLADKLGIDATPATVGGNLAAGTQLAMANAPGSVGVLADAAARENAGLAAAARSTAESLGPVGTRASAGEDLATGAAQVRKDTKAVATQKYQERDRLFGGEQAPVSLDQTRQAFQDISSKFPTSPAVAQLNEHPVLRRLLDPATQGEPLTLGEATEALSHIRGVQRNLSNKSDASGIVLARVGKVEQGLEDDVMAAGRKADLAAGRTPGDEGSAVAAQKNADAYYADRKAALGGTLKVALKANDEPTVQSAESVYNGVVASMQRDGGNLTRLRDTWFRLPDKSKSSFASTLVNDMGRAVHGAQEQPGDLWSFNTFMTNYDKMHPAARNIVFGAKAGEQLDDIAKYASRLRRLDKVRNFSNTAKNLVLGGVMTTVGAALWHGDFATVGEIGGSIAANHVAAKAYLASPAMRQWTKDILKVALMGNEKSQFTAAKVLTNKLGGIARSEPAIASDILSLQSRLTEAFGGAPMKAAADDKSGNEQSQ